MKTIESALRPLGVLCAILGWLWFGSMVFIKYSGAAIYATTEPDDIREFDRVWRESEPVSSLIDSEPGIRFRVKIGGEQ